MNCVFKPKYDQFFSYLFRNMNYLGKKLSVIESRRSLYFMSDKFKDYLDMALRQMVNQFSGNYRLRMESFLIL